MKRIHIRKRGRWCAIWQFDGRQVVRYADTAEHALIALLACEITSASGRREVAAHHSFVNWAVNNGLMQLRQRLMYTKRHGWDSLTKPEAVRVYRKWRKAQTAGTSLGL